MLATTLLTTSVVTVASSSFTSNSSSNSSGNHSTATTTNSVFDAATHQLIVPNQAMGARYYVAADFDCDGHFDILSASSNDAESWCRNEGSIVDYANKEDGNVNFEYLG